MENLSIAGLNNLSPVAVVVNDLVKERFISVHKATHKCSIEESESFYEVTKEQLTSSLMYDDYLSSATGYSVYNCMLDLASWGLPLIAGNNNLIYVLGGNVSIKVPVTEKNKKGVAWKRIMTVELTVSGQEASSIKAGQLRRMSAATVVRADDHFRLIINADGNQSVEYKCDPKGESLIIGGFVKLTFPDGSWEYIYEPYSEIIRRSEYSAKKNKGDANSLYTSGANGQADVGFAKTKFRKGALKHLPQLCMSQYSNVSSADYQEGYERVFGAGLDTDDSEEANAPTQSPNVDAAFADAVAGNVPVAKPVEKIIVEEEEDDDAF